MRLLQSVDWKSDGYDLILVIIDWLMKMVHFKPMQMTIIAIVLVEVILNVVA